MVVAPRVLGGGSAEHVSAKAAVVGCALTVTARSVDERIAQARQYSDENVRNVTFEEISVLRSAMNLGIGGGAHGEVIGRMVESIEQILVANRPDWVLVCGAVNSMLAWALVAAKLHIPVSHVRAGRRCFDRRMPEKANRVLTDHVSSPLLARITAAVVKLSIEDNCGDMVLQVGDVMSDAMLRYRTGTGGYSRILFRVERDPRG